MIQSVTQAIAWQRIQKLLPQSEFVVWSWMREHGFCTRNELDAALGNGRPNAGASRRLSRMERKGMVGRMGARECSVTGHVCDTWIALDAIPKEIPREMGPTARLRHTLMEIEALAAATPGGLFAAQTCQTIKVLARRAINQEAA